MAILKCKMCGDNLDYADGASTAQCESCGSVQTIPKVDDEKKLTLFARANRLRMACEFDKAAGVYEAIVADFPEEAEAYWGLVLCRYGIEYVDDPGTGRKIPTCHRSSFESVLEDSDLEQALENADLLARRVYRDEARQIEELRKGIIAVSANEKNYDIFICYKETDEKGDRTLDSVLAQDVYDALTDKGYRVFFSRISLEDKLGMEYEPYIFAALNSARIMLAFGTDYEHFNAVWVKNEWSRFLKLMAKDKQKHLIPCFKGIDAYDMPKEFAKLQAQDLGKVGAIQDLLRGIEKLLPKSNPTQPAVKEAVVVQQAGGTNANALAKRGYMALEDGDWAKADGFFEEALNHDAECAEAYVGKYLAREHFNTPEQWAESRLKTVSTGGIHMESLRRNTRKEQELIEKYSLPGFEYAEKAQMQRILDKFNFTYASRADSSRLNRDRLEEILQKDPNLSRGFRFAKGEYQATLNRFREDLLSKAKDAVSYAASEAAGTKSLLEADYAAHLQNAEKEFRNMREKAEKVCAGRYDDLCRQQGQARSASDFDRLIEPFTKLSGYRDAYKRAQQCRTRRDELREQARQEEEARRAEQRRLEEARRAEQKRIEEARQAEERRIREEQERQQAKERARKRVITLVVSTVAVVAMVIGIFSFLKSREAERSSAYAAAESLYQSGDLEGAAAAFAELGRYQDADERCLQIRYEAAEGLYRSGDLEGALTAFTALEDYQDAADRCLQIRYEQALNLMDVGSYQEAISAFRDLGDYQDSKARMMEAWGYVVRRKTIDSGDGYIAALKADGTVVTAEILGSWDRTTMYIDRGQLDVSGWTDIVEIACGTKHTVGLRADGTVVATGQNASGECDVSEWTDIVAIDAIYGRTVGLRADGTVLVAGDIYWEEDHSEWTDIVSISIVSDYLYGIRADGTVVLAQSSGYVSSLPDTWENMKSITVGSGIYPIALGLKKDGTVCTYDSWNDDIDTETVGSWTEIVDIVSSARLSVALRADGTVVFADHLDLFDDLDFSGWSDVVDLHMYTDEEIIGLRSDGTLLVKGFTEKTTEGLLQWTDIKTPNR